jgi:hypothetical protein
MFSHRNDRDRNPDLSTQDSILLLLHRTAQPLSTARGILELTLAEPMTEDEKRTWLQQAMAQVVQVTSNFDELRQMIEAQKYGCQPMETRAIPNV